ALCMSRSAVATRGASAVRARSPARCVSRPSGERRAWSEGPGCPPPLLVRKELEEVGAGQDPDGMASVEDEHGRGPLEALDHEVHRLAAPDRRKRGAGDVDD